MYCFPRGNILRTFFNLTVPVTWNTSGTLKHNKIHLQTNYEQEGLESNLLLDMAPCYIS